VNARNVPLQTALVLILLDAVLPLHAQNPDSTVGSDLTVCNKGTVAVEAVFAKSLGSISIFGDWGITGATVDPQECTTINNNLSDLFYVAFGFTDSTGKWGSGTIAQVPDLGSAGFFGTRKVLSGATEPVCAWKGSTFVYSINGKLSIDCATLKLRGRSQEFGQGPLPPLISALQFYPDSRNCGQPVPGVPYECEKTHYYLNISPSATERELHARVGTKSGAERGDDSSSLCGKVSCWDLFLQKLNEAAAQRSAANTNNNPPSPRRSTDPPSPPPRPAVPPPPPDDDDPIGNGGFITPPSRPAAALNPANSLQWVRADIPAYIEASQSGFAAYKKGDAQISQGYRMWDSSVKPSAARGCWVVQGATSTTLSCALSERGDLSALRPYYTDLNTEIAATLPRDWTRVERPFGGDMPNEGYRSSSGAHLEVWFAPAASGAGYEINFQLISAH
jgi:hypothetical protein